MSACPPEREEAGGAAEPDRPARHLRRDDRPERRAVGREGRIAQRRLALIHERPAELVPPLRPRRKPRPGRRAVGREGRIAQRRLALIHERPEELVPPRPLALVPAGGEQRADLPRLPVDAEGLAPPAP